MRGDVLKPRGSHLPIEARPPGYLDVCQSPGGQADGVFPTRRPLQIDLDKSGKTPNIAMTILI
jgi:hypothetical protein